MHTNFRVGGTAVPQLWRLVTTVSPIGAQSLQVGRVVGKVALKQVFLGFLRFYPVGIIPPLQHICGGRTRGFNAGPVTQKHRLTDNLK